MYRLKVLTIPSRTVEEIVSSLPRIDEVLTLLQNWDGEAFAFDTYPDARHYRGILENMLRAASYQDGSPLPPPYWNADWDMFEIVVEVYKPDTGWRRLHDE